MKTIKAQFKDEAGYYTMIFTFNHELWTIKDIISHECKSSKSTFIQFLNLPTYGKSTINYSK